MRTLIRPSSRPRGEATTNEKVSNGHVGGNIRKTVEVWTAPTNHKQHITSRSLKRLKQCDSKAKATTKPATTIQTQVRTRYQYKENSVLGKGRGNRETSKKGRAPKPHPELHLAGHLPA